MTVKAILDQTMEALMMKMTKKDHNYLKKTTTMMMMMFMKMKRTVTLMAFSQTDKMVMLNTTLNRHHQKNLR